LRKFLRRGDVVNVRAEDRKNLIPPATPIAVHFTS
jgi:hypothetical protein